MVPLPLRSPPRRPPPPAAARHGATTTAVAMDDSDLESDLAQDDDVVAPLSPLVPVLGWGEGSSRAPVAAAAGLRSPADGRSSGGGGVGGGVGGAGALLPPVASPPRVPAAATVEFHSGASTATLSTFPPHSSWAADEGERSWGGMAMGSPPLARPLGWRDSGGGGDGGGGDGLLGRMPASAPPPVSASSPSLPHLASPSALPPSAASPAMRSRLAAAAASAAAALTPSTSTSTLALPRSSRRLVAGALVAAAAAVRLSSRARARRGGGDGDGGSGSGGGGGGGASTASPRSLPGSPAWASALERGAGGGLGVEMTTVWRGAGAGGGDAGGAGPIAVNLSLPGGLPPPPPAGSPSATTAAEVAVADAAAEAAEAAERRRRRRHRRLASGDGEIWTAADAAAAAAAAAGGGTPGSTDAGRLPLSPCASTVSVGLGLDEFAAARGYAGASGVLASPLSQLPPGGPARSPALPPLGQGAAGQVGGQQLGDLPPAGLRVPPAAGDDHDGDDGGDDGGDERTGLLLPPALPPTGSGELPPMRSPRLRRRTGAPSKFLLVEPDGRLDLGVDPVAARAGVRLQRAHESAAAALQRGAGEVHDLMALLDPSVLTGGASPLPSSSAGGTPHPHLPLPPPHSRGADGAVAAVGGGGRGSGVGTLRNGDTSVLIDTPPPPSDLSAARSAGGGGGGDDIAGGDGEDAFRQYFWRPDMDGLRPMGEHQAAVLARHEAFVGRLVWLLRLFLAVDIASWVAYAVHVARGVLWEGGSGGAATAAVVSALLPATVRAASNTTTGSAAMATPLPVPPPHYLWTHLVIPVAMVALDVISWVVAGSTAHTPLLLLVVALVIGDIVTVVLYEQAVLLVRLALAGVVVQVAGLRSLSRAQAIEFGLEWEREDGVEGYVVVVDAAGMHAAAARLY
ncbi:hypothetical protein MMPV_000148 [Pyropia vietnamensis]